MIKEMAANAPNAILAINSLDRYITKTVTNNTQFVASWLTVSTVLTLIVNQYSSAPKVGGLIYNTVGIVDGTRILAVSGLTNGSIITISAPTFFPAPAPFGEIVTQEFQESAAQHPVSNALYAVFNNTPPYSSNFTIQSPAALIYGYINRIAVSQVQLQYNISTITTRNSILSIQKAGQKQISYIYIPYGFYFPDELAALMQVEVRANPTLASLVIGVTYTDRDGFIFTATAGGPTGFFFPAIAQLQLTLSNAGALNQLPIILKTYRTFGITVFNSDPPARVQISTEVPNFLYTPYIDICSDVLTNYQTIKDTTTSANKLTSLIARVYLAGSGQVQTVTVGNALGCRPFQVVADLNTPKVIKWTPDVAVPSIDFQMYDQYGDLIVSSEEVINPEDPEGPLVGEGSNTEFQITLLCIEGEEWKTR
jgi:hypothetical protein